MPGRSEIRRRSSSAARKCSSAAVSAPVARSTCPRRDSVSARPRSSPSCSRTDSAERCRSSERSGAPIRKWMRPTSSSAAATPGPSPATSNSLCASSRWAQRARVLAERAQQAADPAVRRPALGRQVEAPGEPQHLLKQPHRLARAPEARRHVAGRIERVHLGDGVVELEQANPGQVERVRPVEQQVVARQGRRRDVAVRRAPRVARLFVEARQRLEALLALRRPAPPRLSSHCAANALRRRAELGGSVGLQQPALDRLRERPGRLLGDRGLGNRWTNPRSRRLSRICSISVMVGSGANTAASSGGEAASRPSATTPPVQN